MMNRIKMVVFGLNANGDPDLFFCRVDATPEEISYGYHYDKAWDAADDAGYCPHMAADENDPAGAVMQLCIWETIP